MSLTEVLPAVQMLSRGEKLRLIQLLAEELAEKEETPLLEAGQAYPVWSPHDAHEAAAVLLQRPPVDRPRRDATVNAPDRGK